MFGKVLFKLTGVFLIIYISITSATPARAAVVKTQNTSDDTQALAPTRNYYPQYQCQFPFFWKRRECTAGPGSWQDVCVHWQYGNNAGPSTIPESMTVNKTGVCAGFSFCLDTIKYTAIKENEYVDFVACIADWNGKGQRAIDAQAGTSGPIRARIIATTPEKQSVTIDHDMTHATVSAVLKSECRTINVYCPSSRFAHARESIP